MIKPTVGRVVWFYHSTAPQEPLAAIVSHVYDDQLVNLMVIERDGNTRGLMDVQLLQDDDKPDEDWWCAWMPYQLGQAARAEAAEKAASA